ncbi:MAG: hypothetical protein ACP5LH_02790 [Candidatus Micrarchaeia archaeon]
MALNPDDLLIFKVREEESEKEKKEKKKKEEQKAVEKATTQQAATETHAKVEEAQPSANKEAAQQKEVVSVSTEEKQNEEVQQPSVKYTSEAKEREIGGNEPIFYTVAPAETAEEMVEGPGFKDHELSEVEINKALKKKSLSAKESRRIGEHMACVWHPWRQAYAICDYCRRPFCYEDLVEHNGLYYCLEDIDKVYNTKETELIKYNNFRLLSSTFLFFVFFIFLYYNYNSIVAIPSEIQSIGMNAFFENMFTPLGFMIAKTALVLLSLLTSFIITADLKKSFSITVIVCVLTALLFSYLYIETNTFYFIIIAMLSLASIVVLAYSKASYSTNHNVSEEDLASEVLHTTKATF